MDKPPVDKQPSVLFTRLPDFVQPQAAALGIRVKSPGKEHTVLEGQFSNGTNGNGKPVTARVVIQLPGSVELSGFRAESRSLKYESFAEATSVSPDDAILLETFSTDTAEGMLNAIQDGALVELIGRNIQPNPGTISKDLEIAYDIYEVTGPVKTRRDHLSRTKLYYFNSQNGLLVRTRYEDGRSVIETRFADWRKVDGSAYPGRIERFENDRLVFSFVVTTVSAGPKVDSAAFR
jgi:hypothetical protein